MAEVLTFGVVSARSSASLAEVVVVHVDQGHQPLAQPGDFVDADEALVGTADHGHAQLRVGRGFGQDSGGGKDTRGDGSRAADRDGAKQAAASKTLGHGRVPRETNEGQMSDRSIAPGVRGREALVTPVHGHRTATPVQTPRIPPSRGSARRIGHARVHSIGILTCRAAACYNRPIDRRR